MSGQGSTISIRPSLLGNARLAQTLGHMLMGDWVGIAIQIPAHRIRGATGQGAYLGKCACGLLIALELDIARDQDEGAVRMRLDAASCQRGLDRLLVTSQMIKRPGLVGEPGGGPRIAGAEAQPGIDRFESCVVAAVKSQRNFKEKMTESEVPVQLDRAVRIQYARPHCASPTA